jgi:hypothetical protein
MRECANVLADTAQFERPPAVRPEAVKANKFHKTRTALGQSRAATCRAGADVQSPLRVDRRGATTTKVVVSSSATANQCPSDQRQRQPSNRYCISEQWRNLRGLNAVNEASASVCPNATDVSVCEGRALVIPLRLGTEFRPVNASVRPRDRCLPLATAGARQ